MKQSFVQCAKLLLEPDADPAAPGGAVTVALCGSWTHAGACRWSHHTSAVWEQQQVSVRVVFIAEEEDENNVRALINRALDNGECVGPDGKVSRWEMLEQSAGILTECEETLGRSWGG